jgi:hypothetical protein
VAVRCWAWTTATIAPGRAKIPFTLREYAHGLRAGSCGNARLACVDLAYPRVVTGRRLVAGMIAAYG